MATCKLNNTREPSTGVLASVYKNACSGLRVSASALPLISFSSVHFYSVDHDDYSDVAQIACGNEDGYSRRGF